MVGPGLARNVLATLDVAGLRLLHAASAATDLGTHRASRDSATDCGNSVARSATDLVTENATDHGTDERSGNVQVAGPTLGNGTCSRSIQHRCSGGPTTARTEVTFARYSRSSLRRRLS